MHVSYEPQIIFVPRSLADGLAPFFDGLQYFALYTAWSDWWALWKAPNKFIEEFFSTDLQVEWVATVFDTYVQQGQGEYGNIRISVVDELHDGHSSFSRCIALFGVY